MCKCKLSELEFILHSKSLKALTVPSERIMHSMAGQVWVTVLENILQLCLKFIYISESYSCKYMPSTQLSYIKEM